MSAIRCSSGLGRSMLASPFLGKTSAQKPPRHAQHGEELPSPINLFEDTASDPAHAKADTRAHAGITGRSGLRSARFMSPMLLSPRCAGGHKLAPEPCQLAQLINAKPRRGERAGEKVGSGAELQDRGERTTPRKLDSNLSSDSSAHGEPESARTVLSPLSCNVDCGGMGKRRPVAGPVAGCQATQKTRDESSIPLATPLLPGQTIESMRVRIERETRAKVEAECRARADREQALAETARRADAERQRQQQQEKRLREKIEAEIREEEYSRRRAEAEAQERRRQEEIARAKQQAQAAAAKAAQQQRQQEHERRQKEQEELRLRIEHEMRQKIRAEMEKEAAEIRQEEERLRRECEARERRKQAAAANAAAAAAASALLAANSAEHAAISAISAATTLSNELKAEAQRQAQVKRDAEMVRRARAAAAEAEQARNEAQNEVARLQKQIEAAHKQERAALERAQSEPVNTSTVEEHRRQEHTSAKAAMRALGEDFREKSMVRQQRCHRHGSDRNYTAQQLCTPSFAKLRRHVTQQHKEFAISGKVQLIAKAQSDVRPPPLFDNALSCSKCKREFGFFLRRHHCRSCGRSFCDHDSTFRVPMPWFGFDDPVRTCEECVPYVRDKHRTRVCCIEVPAKSGRS